MCAALVNETGARKLVETAGTVKVDVLLLGKYAGTDAQRARLLYTGGLRNESM